MADLYSGGKVGIDIVPVADEFGTKLDAILARYRNEKVEVEARIKADSSDYRRTASSINGRTLTNIVKIEGDANGLRKLGREYDKVRQQWEKRPITANLSFGAEAFRSTLPALFNSVKKEAEAAADSVAQSGATASRKIDEQFEQARRNRLLLTDQEQQLIAKAETMVRKETAAYKKLDDQITASKAHAADLEQSVMSVAKTVDYYKRKRDEARQSGDAFNLKSFRNGLKQAEPRLRELRKELREANRETASLQKTQSKLFGPSFNKQLSAVNSELGKTSKALDTATEKMGKLAKASDLKIGQVADFHKSTVQYVGGLSDIIRMEKQHAELLREQADLTPDVTEGQQLLADAMRGTSINSAALHDNLVRGQSAMARNQREAKELTDLFDEQKKSVLDLSKAFHDFKPMGIGKATAKSLNDTLAQLDKLRDFASRKPITAKLTLDKTQWDKKYADLMHDAEELRRKLERDHEIDVRVKVWDDQADQLEERLNRLRRQRLDIPVEWQVDQEKIIARMREIARQIKADPDRQWELEADLDLDMKHAEEKLKKLEKDHDEFKMDVDLETALARAHLAYFTRPRTIDIFANFKGTDLGKILTGMTSGATGLKGVENQFQNLVNLFDKLDKSVPKWSILGAGVTALGAGLLNLGRTAGGVGVSLVSMTKAALAAPAALSGLASAGYVGLKVFQDAQEKIENTGTALDGLNHELGESAWKEYGDELLRVINKIAPTVKSGMNGIAESEGKAAAGLAKIVEQSDASGELPNIFTQTRNAVDNLNPGLQGLVKAFLSLGDQTSKYLPRMASYVSDVADQWARWVDTAKKTGQIDKAMADAIEQGGYLKSSVKDLIGILEGTLGTLAKSENGIQGFSETLSKANDAVHTVRFQDTLEAWSRGAQTAQDNMRNAFKDIGDAAYALRDTTESVFGDAGAIIGEGITGISRMLRSSDKGIRDFSSGIRDGFSSLFDAVGDAGPMFSDLTSMVGQFSRTFGGTLATSLRAASPLIQSIAKGAETVARLFDALPEPVKAMAGIWVTFGRAGVNAFNSLKMGMLQNVMQTMQYQRMLKELGLSADQASVKMGTLIKAMNQLRSGQYAGILSGAITEVKQYGDAAEKTAGKGETLANTQGTVVASLKNVGDTAETQGGRFDKLKTGVGNVVDAFGGWSTIAFMGISTGVSLVGSAIADYTAKAEETKQGTQTAIDNLKTLKSSAKETADALNDYKDQIGKNWSDSSLVFGDGAEGWWSKLFTQITGGFTNAKDAASELGIKMEDLNDAVSGNEDKYKDLVKQLEETSRETYTTTDAYGAVSEKSTQAARAAQILLEALKKQHKDGWEAAADATDKYLNSIEHVNDMQSTLSDKLSLLNDSFEHNGNTLDEATAGGKRNSDMLKDLAVNARMTAYQMLTYGQKTGETAKYTQLAVNAVGDARDAVIRFAEQAGMSSDAAEKFANDLGLIPNDVGVTITADSKPARDVVETLLGTISTLTTDQKQIVLSLYDEGVLNDLAAVELAIKGVTGGASKKDVEILLQAQDDASKKITDAKKLAEAFGVDPAKIDILAKDDASEEFKKVKQQLLDSGLDEKQVQIIIDALNEQAKKKMDEVEEKKKTVNKPSSFDIDANDDQAQAVIATYVDGDGKTIASRNVDINGTDNASGPAKTAKGNVEAIPLLWKTVVDSSGNTSPFAIAAKLAVSNIPRSWLTALSARGDTRQTADNTRIAVKNIPTHVTTWLNSAGDAYSTATNLLSTLREIAGNTWKAVVSTVTGGHHATGGRIIGPGSGTSDSIPAWLSNGEMILKASSVRKLDAKYGRNFLNALNQYGDITGRRASQPSASGLEAIARAQRFAEGGRVRALNGNVNVEVKPVVNVQLPAGSSKGGDTYVTQNFDTKIVRPADDMYVAASILHRNAAQLAGRLNR